MPSPPKYLTAADAAQLLGVDPSRIRQLVMSGAIPADKILRLNPRMNLIERSVITRILKENAGKTGAKRGPKKSSK